METLTLPLPPPPPPPDWPLQKAVQEFPPGPVLRMLKWKRFPEDLDFTRPKRVMIVGQPGTGKGALLETLSVLPRGKIIDVFGPKDNESLAWCRHKRYKNGVLLLHGDNATVSCEWDTMKASELRLHDIEEHQTVISVPGFYESTREQWKAIRRISEVIWQRQSWKKGDVWTVNVREGASLLYSRIGLGGDQGTAKNEMIYSIREFRHSGCHCIVDALDFMGLDVSFRRISDYVFLKAVGNEGLPDRLGWIYRYYDLFVDLMKMPTYAFVFFSRMGGVGHGVFTRPYWHKEEDEDIKQLLNIEVEFGEASPEVHSNYVSNLEHKRIIELRCQINPAKGKIWGILAIAHKVSRSSAVVNWHIDQHNQAVAAGGECDRCRQAKSSFSTRLIPKHQLKEDSDDYRNLVQTSNGGEENL